MRYALAALSVPRTVLRTRTIDVIMRTGHNYLPFRDLISAITDNTIPSTANANEIIEIVFIIFVDL